MINRNTATAGVRRTSKVRATRVPGFQSIRYVSSVAARETIGMLSRTERTNMIANSLETFVESTSSTWGPLSSELVAACRRGLEQLLEAPPTEEWLAGLHRDAPDSRELYRDPAHGFVLLAHAECAGLYRPPYDHGRGWVIYAVQRGEIEMATYMRAQGLNGRVQLVKRDATPVRAGQVKVFLPGDIHDTLCVRGPALLFRFTDRDLKKEDKEERRVTRYMERDGVWTERAA
jgi:hypothetical protein